MCRGLFRRVTPLLYANFLWSEIPLRQWWGRFAIYEIILEREGKVEPGSCVSKHGQIDNIRIEGRHFDECPQIDPSYIHKRNYPYNNQGSLAEMRLMQIERPAFWILEIVVMKGALEALVVSKFVFLHLRIINIKILHYYYQDYQE